jgi:putative FmdB family regulatory protein
MPIYAYRCEACGHAKDVLQKISDPLLTVCPSCGAEAFKKQVTAAGFQLKGSGWYVTDFRGDSKGAKPAAEGGAGDAKTDAANGKAETAKSDASKGDVSKSGDAAKADAGKSSAAAAAAPAPAAAPASGSGAAGSTAGGQ